MADAIIIGLVGIAVCYVILAIGIWAGRKYKQYTEVDSMLAGRKLGSFVAASTMSVALQYSDHMLVLVVKRIFRVAGVRTLLCSLLATVALVSLLSYPTPHKPGQLVIVKTTRNKCVTSTLTNDMSTTDKDMLKPTTEKRVKPSKLKKTTPSEENKNGPSEPPTTDSSEKHTIEAPSERNKNGPSEPRTTDASEKHTMQTSQPNKAGPSEGQVGEDDKRARPFCAVPVVETLASNTSQGCKLAEFDPFDPSVMKFINPPGKLVCPGARITRYRKGVIELHPLAKQDSKETKPKSMKYNTIRRTPETDWGFVLGKNVTIDINKGVNLVKDEFIKIESQTEDGKTHIEFHAAVVPKPGVMARPIKDKGIPLNVVMIGFDSISHAHFQRVFKDEYNFLKKDLRSVFMKGYTIVGDGTTPALTAFLTGQFEQELPEARRDFKGSDTVDGWPWVFADYKSSGYATMFSEDCPDFGAWNYRLHGFKHPPTDHFSRYFWQAARLTRGHCIHSQPQHQLHFDYIESFFEAYPKRPKFGVAFFTDLSHNSLNSAFVGAGDFLSLLKRLHQGNFLNDTLLITFGDHGFRYGESRVSLQGHLEERLPLLAFTFPYWFESEYPDVVENLSENSKSMTSPFDLHATLKHIVAFPESPVGLKHGMSLFDEIPKSRECKEAGVAEHYCPCLSLKPADPEHPHIEQSAQAVITHINNLTSSDAKSAKLCQRLTLKKILSSYQQMANTKFQQFLGSADVHGREPKFAEGKVTQHECNYRIQIETSPGDGLFDVAVRYMNGEFRVAGDISRINKYGEQPRCILDSRPDLRKYCLCKDFVAKAAPSGR